jgi:hypothetical protein
MMESAKALVPAEELQHFREFLAEKKRDFKREDALLALERVKEIADEN